MKTPASQAAGESCLSFINVGALESGSRNRELAFSRKLG